MKQAHYLPLLAGKLLNTPLFILPEKADVLASLLSERMGLDWDSGSIGMFDDEGLDSLGGVREKRPFDVQNNKAIIPVIGTLTDLSTNMDSFSGMRSYASIRRDMEQAAASEDVREQVLFLHTPGGTATGFFEFLDWLRLFSEEMKVTGWVHGNCLSAGFGIGSACSELVISQNAMLGSVGTMILHADMSKQEAERGIKVTALFAGDRKNDGTPHEPLSDAAREAILARVNAQNDIFIGKVAQFTGMSPSAVRATQAGVFVGQQAIDIGFADEIGTFDGVLEAPITEERSFFMALENIETVTAGKHFAAVLNATITAREAKGERLVDLITALQTATGLRNKGVKELLASSSFEGLPVEYIPKIAAALKIEETALQDAAKLDGGEPEAAPAPAGEPAPAPAPPAKTPDPGEPGQVLHSQEAVDGMVASSVTAERERISKIFELSMKGGMLETFKQCAFTNPVSAEQAGLQLYEANLKTKDTARTQFSQEFITPLDVPAPEGPGGELASDEAIPTEAKAAADWVNDQRKKGMQSESRPA